MSLGDADALVTTDVRMPTEAFIAIDNVKMGMTPVVFSFRVYVEKRQLRVKKASEVADSQGSLQPCEQILSVLFD